MLNTEPLFLTNDSSWKKMALAFAATNFGKLLPIIILLCVGAVIIAADLGSNSLGLVFGISFLIVSVTVIISLLILRKYCVTVLPPSPCGCAGKGFIEILLKVRGGLVQAASNWALWGKEDIIHLIIPLRDDCCQGLPVVPLNDAALTVPVRYLGFICEGRTTPVKWQELYDFAIVENGVASVSQALQKRFRDEAQKNLARWTYTMRSYLHGELYEDQLMLRLAQEISTWDLCPFAPIAFSFDSPSIKNQHHAILA